jgi:hypothetical protein
MCDSNFEALSFFSISLRQQLKQKRKITSNGNELVLCRSHVSDEQKDYLDSLRKIGDICADLLFPSLTFNLLGQCLRGVVRNTEVFHENQFSGVNGFHLNISVI